MTLTTVRFTSGEITDGVASGASGDNQLTAGGLLFTIIADGNWTANFDNERFNFSEDPTVGDHPFTINISRAQAATFNYTDFQVSYHATPGLVTDPSDGSQWTPYLTIGPISNLADDLYSGGPVTLQHMFPGMTIGPVGSLQLGDHAISSIPGSPNPTSSLWIDNITADVNVNPIITNFDASDNKTFTEGGAPLVIDGFPSTTVTDPDATGWSGGNLTFRISSGRVNAEDVLSVQNSGSGGAIGVSGSNITYLGTVIGTFAGGTGSSSLVVTFNANATDQSIQSLIGALTYHNLNDIDPSTSTRTLTLTLTDAEGATSAPATTTVSVTAVNDAPVAVNDTLSAVEDTSVTYSATDLLGNDTDADNTHGQLSIASVTSGLHGVAVLNGDGTVTFTPAANYNGPADFTYTVTDGTTASAPATVTVNVSAVNDAPVAVNDTLSAVEDTSVTYSVADLLGNDTDIDSAHGLLSIASVTNGSHGVVVLNGDGTVTFTPAANYNGPADFTYTVTDGTIISAPATVTVNVSAIDDAPAAVDDTLSAVEDTSVTYSAADLLGNDTDIDSAGLLSIASVTNGSHGVVVLNGDGTVTFTPAANYNGPADFTYTVTDGTTVSAPATVTVNVSAVDDPSVAVDDAFITDEATAISAGLSLFSANPTSPDTDVDSPLSITAVNGVSGNVGVQITLASGALLTVNADGTFGYDPNGVFNHLPDYVTSGSIDATATDSFTYTLADGSTATATVTVRGLDSNGDKVNGTSGSDILDGGLGNNTLAGGDGDDIYIVSSTGNRIVEAGGEGRDTIRSSVDWTIGANIERLELQGTANLTGNGNTLANTLGGNSGNNILRGGAGNDTLAGYLGNDRLVGGEGKDNFVFNTVLGPNNVDTITDYNVADDMIQLDKGIFFGLAAGWLTAAAFHIGTAAHDASDRIIFNSTTGGLFFDKDGIGGAAATQFATLTPGLAMNANEFFVA
ncbi:tandem-95 repeat protein [Mesorhizobium sp. CGMCC 1.15528]|uniref:Tandem-95 repeat protein n=1 Tax=Mesorhizobium zhangyense TaxID=1776730 RepID=A0A7C9RBZ0_9HYPH|nr:tandem-95 repeat protein [Mesorhizobium zhangyense]NGN45320.1 tandem-95 repeat protein [Mesorhizobium zhangyense]